MNRWNKLRGRHLAPPLGSAAVVCTLLLVASAMQERAGRRHLDQLVTELGESVVETAATSIRASDAVLRRLDDEIREGLRARSTTLNSATAESARRLEQFAFANRIRHLLILSPDGALIAETGDLPEARAADAALLDAARQLINGQDATSLVRGAGRSPWIVHARRLSEDRWAVLFQDASIFARTRREAGPDAVVARLQSETPIAFVRFSQPLPDPSPTIRTFHRELTEPAGVLTIGLHTGSIDRSLLIQRAGSRWVAALSGLATALAVWFIGRLRRTRTALTRRVEHEERLAGLGRLAANIAHEVRNPLNAIGLAAQRIERRGDLTDETKALARIINDEVGRLDRTVSDVLHQARPGPAQLAWIDLAALVETVAALAAAEAQERNVTIKVEGEPRRLSGDADLLRGALWNLLRNAVGVSPAGSTVRLRTDADEHEVQLSVEDEGPGLPNRAPDALFEPYVSERPGGSGLGLSLALAAAQAHGGTIEARNRSGGGSVFRLRIPLTGELR